MSSEWAVQRLDQIAEINPTRKVHKGSAVPFVDMAALPQFSRDISVNDVVVREAKGAGAHFQNGDTLLARITPCLENGKTAQVRCLDGDAIAEGSTEFIVLCGKDPADNDYIYYLCREPAFREYAIGRMEGTSGRQRVSWQSIAAYQFAFPSPEERRETARVLSTLDDRITLLRETNATLEAIAQALFKSWFVDFDPVRAKMEGRTPEGMDEATAALFPDGLETSELGEVPRGWRVAKVGEVAEVVKGKSYSSKDLVDSHHTALVTLKSFERGGGFRMDGFKPYSGAYKPSQVVSAGDLIVAYTDVTQAAELIGKPAVVVGVDEYTTLVASLDVGIVRPDERHCGKQFLYGLFRTDAFQSHTLAHTSGTTVLHLAKDGIGSFAFALPPNELIRSFEVIAAAIASRKQTNSDAVRTLSTLRDTLLPRLISGQLRLPEAQAAVEAAL